MFRRVSCESAPGSIAESGTRPSASCSWIATKDSLDDSANLNHCARLVETPHKRPWTRIWSNDSARAGPRYCSEDFPYPARRTSIRDSEAFWEHCFGTSGLLRGKPAPESELREGRRSAHKRGRRVAAAHEVRSAMTRSFVPTETKKASSTRPYGTRARSSPGWNYANQGAVLREVKHCLLVSEPTNALIEWSRW